MKLKIKYLPNYLPDWPRLAFAHPGDSGLDLRAAIAEPLVLKAGQRALVPNGVQMEMEADSSDYEVQIRPRSGLAAKAGLFVLNTPGTIDWGYRGEYKTILFNSSTEDVTIQPGDRISQAVVCPIVRPQIEEVTDMSATQRGDKGFGSSGV
ncbi:MAG: dUTP diphosphatase [Alphaproteobacteria bacterium]|nr:dUTP diphosphatase [Alphaproteobacteria bacterium]